ncbi:hypothetical protein OS175_00585 [Marinicella sp. S1101]|uniref:hypothetical protein n=1 Tax=Marinicella marina TaxID=2996016 RepID=UPI002260F534|nr:hypothetical protein [Marinicella marina]MCX7552358.1 hypothetical protein [Marinicella marina]MDJ1139233.1 hypothetical protein [Marinicella marina]
MKQLIFNLKEHLQHKTYGDRRRVPSIQACLMLLLITTINTAMADQSPTGIDQAMYFKSHVRDADYCKNRISVKDEALIFSQVSSPAMSCPDAFAWKQFLEAVKAEFWQNWAIDQQIWVAKPKAFCADKNATDCCALDAKTGGTKYRGSAKNGDAHCPLYPASIGGIKLTEFNDKQQLSPHSASEASHLDDDVSRVARDVEAEIVYHNKPFFNYSVENNLYHTNGLVDIYKQEQYQASEQAPYRPVGQGVSYPQEAVMFKVDFVSEEVMLALGYISDHDNNPDTPMNHAEHPYITMEIQSPESKKTRTHYLVAVTGASKALPNWHWYAFEHVNNIGRCDYIGCNDSFGFKTTVALNTADGTQKQFMSHYIPPKQVTSDLGDNLFVRNEKYPSADMTPQLAALFKGMDIGQGKVSHVSKKNPMPTTTSAAWQSYRLKGTQTSYYNNDGTPVILGASVTEGGFVNTASCMSCHVQAGANAEGPNGNTVGGIQQLSLDGIGKVTNGAPEKAVFFQPGTTQLNTARSDFVWGVLNASPLSDD